MTTPTWNDTTPMWDETMAMPPKKRSKSSQIMNAVEQSLSPHEFSPQSLLQKIPELASRGAHKGGEFVSTDLAYRGMNPNAAAGVGTAISMGPDIMLAGINPISSSLKTIPNLAVSTQRRALGFKVPELKTEFARGQAARAARVALEKGVTSATGNPDVMFRKASSLKSKTGQKLGSIRESVGPQPLQPILQAIDDYKSVRLKGATGGKWDSVSRKVNEAKETIKGLVSKPKGYGEPGTPDVITGKTAPPFMPIPEPKVSLKRVAAAKKEIADSVNWMADNVSQRDAKGLAMAIEKGTEQSLAAAGGDIKTYKQLKPLYSAAKTMIKGLNREIAIQEGNRAVGLPALVAGASGGPGMALKIGATELAFRRGAGVAASELMGAANIPKTSGIPLVQVTKTLTVDKAKEYLKKSKNDREKARQMAIKDGWEIPE